MISLHELEKIWVVFLSVLLHISTNIGLMELQRSRTIVTR